MTEGLKAAPTGAPEAYTAFTVPEGYTLDEAANTGAQTLFKELGLSQSQAQQLVNFYSEHAIKSNEGLMESVRQQNENWQNEAKEHPDLKGKLEQGGPVLTTISRALDMLGDGQLKADFQEAMDYTGAGNHPAFIRTFYKLAAKLVEGKPVAASGVSPHGTAQPGRQQMPTAAQAMYPNLPSTARGG